MNFAKRYGVNLKEQVEKYGGPYLTRFDEYAKITGEAQALMLNSQVRYIAAVDEQSKTLLDGWDKVKSQAKTEQILNSVWMVADVVSGLGIGAAGAYSLWTRDARTWTNAKKFWDVGTNGGDVLDLVSVAFNTYNFYNSVQKLKINKTPNDINGWVQNQVKKITSKSGNFGLLIDRIRDHVTRAKEPRTDPNPWVPQ